MQQKSDVHIFQGMQLDMDPHKHKPEYLVDAKNIRITNMGESTEFAITSEKSTEDMYVDMEGTYLGHCVLNNILVVFTHQEASLEKELLDRIYIITILEDGTFSKKVIEKNLGFNIDNPIEAFGMYENEIIQKIYWIDGINQPRFIIIDDYHLERYSRLSDTCFDFVNTLQLKENVSITKEFGTGYFPAGSIQYAFNYYNKYGQESNIAWVSPLYYTSFIDRGGSPEETIGNSFRINIDNVDTNFEYLRLYSIMRTSKSAQPTVKIVRDIKISDSSLYIDDTNLGGENIDPTSLLYKGGEEISAKCLTHKDGTLFLGNINIKRSQISNNDVNLIGDIIEGHREVIAPGEFDSFYPKGLFNNCYEIKENNKKVLTSPQTFKTGETYRLGIQFQYKTGKWSDPIYITDHTIISNNIAKLTTENKEELVTLVGNISIGARKSDTDGYVKIRPVIVQPYLVNQRIVAQGVLCPTVMWKPNQDFLGNEVGMPYVQSSWFTRCYNSGNYNKNTGVYNLTGHHPLFMDGSYLNSFQGYNSEIQNSLNLGKNPEDPKSAMILRREPNNIFKVSTKFMTLHSPDIQFNEDLSHIDASTLNCKIIQRANITGSAGDISITTSSPTISSTGSGFVHKTIKSNNSGTLMSGFFYNDAMVSRDGDDFIPLTEDSRYFMIYPWHRSGSLNNDCVRGGKGTRSAVLKRKVISNIKVSKSSTKAVKSIKSSGVALFNSDQLNITKVNSFSYYGNIDTLISNETSYSTLNGGKWVDKSDPALADFTSVANNTYLIGTKYSPKFDTNRDKYVVIENESIKQTDIDAELSNTTEGLSTTKEPIRIKYKSTPHAIINFSTTVDYDSSESDYLYMGELYRELEKPYGDKSEEVLKTHIWIPAGDAVSIENKNAVEVTWKYGDTYLQRFDCLKTYSFTPEDENSIIDIVSFMAETRVNIEGRYDRNRGLLSNLTVSPTNFNLLNDAYTQFDNFFNYRILDEDFYKLNVFSNSVTWTLEHKTAEDIDNWTNVNLASIIDLDGNKGELNSLQTLNSDIIAFQDNGISKILFNSRVQLNASDGIPIEIGNNYKVDGKVYISDSIGCNNKWGICKTPSGIYFIDSDTKNLYNLGADGSLSDISSNKFMSTWFKRRDYQDLASKLRLFYDFNRNDLYINTSNTCLNYNEKLGAFISFFDYHKASALFNINDHYYGLVNSNSLKLWRLFANSKPCNIFGFPQDYYLSFISNPDSANKKLFTNMEIRADWRNLIDLGDGKGNDLNIFFDSVRVSNEYQDTEPVDLLSLKDRPSNLKEKFRIWRIQLPRDKKHKRDRISNPWAKITLFKSKDNLGENPFILHDLSVQYYI